MVSHHQKRQAKSYRQDWTYYRQRKDLMEYAINIDIRPCEKASSNVIPMFRVLEAKPAQIPDWAFTSNVIHYSAMGAA
ncbi:phage/plasmid replication protein, II/X family [Bowmanella pacifica]|nr:phage/plasmid replication protein, II/X family [Bowmanella pacifica]